MRHPYVEAGIDKPTVRALSAHLGMGSVAKLASSPCLSSRVETGIPIDPAALAAVHSIERLVRRHARREDRALPGSRRGLVVELDRPTLDALDLSEAAGCSTASAASGPVRSCRRCASRRTATAARS